MTAIYRCDQFSHAMNPGKDVQVRAVLAVWRQAAVLAGREQWRLFFETGRFNSFHNGSLVHLAAHGRSRGEEVRRQVTGVLTGHIATVQQDFSRLVEQSTLPDDIRHQLHVINRCHAWFTQGPMVMRGTEVPIPDTVRRLARRLMRRTLAQRCRPRLDRMGTIGSKKTFRLTTAAQSEAKQFSGNDHFPLWVRVSTLTPRKPIWVPLLANPYAQTRPGTRSGAIQVTERNGRLVFGLVTDVSAPCKTSREAYAPRVPVLALDFGLRTLMATSQGDLLGRNFLNRLKKYDQRIAVLASHRQRQGLKVRCPKYDALVCQMRGFIGNEVNRVMNRLVEIHQPAHLVLERLDFRNSNLSRRLNRLVGNCGRSVLQQKLQDLEDRFGITNEEVPAAYSSQECGNCGYVDHRNRTGEHFQCLWCGKTCHADVQATRPLLARAGRSGASRVWPTKEDILLTLVRQFQERHAGPRSGPADPRKTNPYFGNWVHPQLSNRGPPCVTLMQVPVSLLG